MGLKAYDDMNDEEKAEYEYEERMKWIRDINSRIRTATEKGRKEGRKVGREEGREERREEVRIEFIKLSLNNGKTIKEIAEFIGLPEIRVNELAEKIKKDR